MRTAQFLGMRGNTRLVSVGYNNDPLDTDNSDDRHLTVNLRDQSRHVNSAGRENDLTFDIYDEETGLDFQMISANNNIRPDQHLPRN